MKEFRLTRNLGAHLLTALLLVNLTALVGASQSLTFAVVGDTGEEGKDQRAM